MKFLGSPLLFYISLFIFIYLIFRYWNYLSRFQLTSRYILIFLRFFSIIILLYLVINPWFSWETSKYEKSKVAVIFDISKSMYSHLSDYKIKYIDLKKKIDLWSDTGNVDINYYGLGKTIYMIDDVEKLNKESSYDLSTNFSNMITSLDLDKHNNIVLISDGMATEGMRLNEINFDEFPAIYSIGAGPTKLNEDIAILDVNISDNLIGSDSIEIKIKIKSQLSSMREEPMIITDSKGDIIYNELIFLNDGNHLKEIVLQYSKDSLSGLNLVEIPPIYHESIIENNKLSFNIDPQNKLDNIMLLTGAYSSNSTIIKNNLNKIKGVKINNYFRYDSNSWNYDLMSVSYNDAKLIILDDFPNNRSDETLFNHIISVSSEFDIPIIYLQGPALNLDGAEIIHQNYPEIYPMVDNTNSLIDVDHQSVWSRNIDFDMSYFPPQKRNIKWINKNSSLINYLDGSLLLENFKNFFIISLPNLSESYYKTSFNNQAVINAFLDKVFISAYYGETKMLVLEIDGKSFNLGEYVELSLNTIDGLSLKNHNYNAIYNNDTIRLDCDQYIAKNSLECFSTFSLSGEYIVYSSAETSGNKKIFSNMEKISIAMIDNEMEELIQDSNALIKISYDTGGIYSNLDSLDIILKEIDISPVQLIKKHKLSALSTHNYWWILLVYLSIEWFFRKKDGLL